MDKRILSKYILCNQSMVTADNADQILIDLKLCLNDGLDNLSMMYLSYSDVSGKIDPTTKNLLPSLQLAAYLDEQDSIIESYASYHNHANVKIITRATKEESIVSLLENGDLNSDSDLQNSLAKFLSIIPEDRSIFCFPACIPIELTNTLSESSSKRVWCLLLGNKDKQSFNYVAENSNMILVLVNLVFSHIARIEALQQLKIENEKNRDELKKIAKLQRLLLPKDDIAIRGVDIAANFRACEHAGGDYYDLTVLTELLESNSTGHHEDFWGSMIADSAGHGAEAAVEISMFDAILRTINDKNSNIDKGPAGVFNYSNQHLFTRIIRGTFITAFIAGYNPESEQIIYACAGHPPALLYRAASKDIIELDKSQGIPLGVVKDYTWENHFVAFSRGDIFVMMTDGILEAGNVNGEQYGVERLKKLVIKNCKKSSKDILRLVEDRVDIFQNTKERKDDQTLVILKRD